MAESGEGRGGYRGVLNETNSGWDGTMLVSEHAREVKLGKELLSCVHYCFSFLKKKGAVGATRWVCSVYTCMFVGLGR